MILPYINQYLWDVKTDDKDFLKSNADFIIERILEYGDIKGLKWLEKTYPRKKIVKVLSKSSKISAKTGSFFALYYKIPKEKLLCIQKPFTQKQNRF